MFQVLDLYQVGEKNQGEFFFPLFIFSKLSHSCFRRYLGMDQ